MDLFWQAVANFLVDNDLAAAAVVAPAEFRNTLKVDKTYGEVELVDAARIDVLVLHKDLFQKLDRHFVKAALGRRRPSFANEVFIVMTAGNETMDPTAPHLEGLSAIRTWAHGVEIVRPPPKGAILPHSDSLLYATDGRYTDPLNLSQARAQVYSQNNEDGILAEIFRRIGILNGTFLEIGVENGLQNNTRFLLERGWKGTWVDGEKNADEARLLFSGHVAANDLCVIGHHVTAENINQLLDRDQVPKQIDLISVDIDQNTTHVWRALDRKARVCCIEYNASLPPSNDVEVTYDPATTWDGSNWYDGSLKAIETIGRAKGMSLVGCDLLGVNAFLVADEDVQGRFRAPFTAENHYEAPKFRLTSHLGHPPSRRPRQWLKR